MSEKKRGRRTNVVPAKDYQPTKAEMDEPIALDGTGVSLDQAMGRILAPVDVQEVSADDWREQRERRGRESS